MLLVAKPPRGFARFLVLGAGLLKNPRLLKQLLTRAVGKLGRADKGPLAEMKEQLLRMIALVKAYVSGDYREVSTQTMVTVVAAILYFVVPFDAVPDFLFGWGLVDDAAVLSFVVAQIAGELDAFAEWQKAQANDDDLPSDPSDDQDS